MKVKDLIAILSGENGDLHVMVYADHGQQAEDVYSVEELVIDKTGYTSHPDDLKTDGWDQQEIDKLERVVVISS